MEAAASSQRTLSYLQTIVLVYTIFFLPLFYLAIIRYSATYGIALSDILNTLGIGLPAVLTLTLMIILWISVSLCMPAFYATSIVQGGIMSQWSTYLDPRRWPDASGQPPDWRRLVRSIAPGIVVFHIILLIGLMLSGQSDAIIFLEAVVILLLLLIVLGTSYSFSSTRQNGEESSPNSADGDETDATATDAPPDTTDRAKATDCQRTTSLIKQTWQILEEYFPNFNFIMIVYSFLLFYLIAILIDRTASQLSITSQSNVEIWTFAAAHIIFFMVLLALVLLPVFLGKPQAALVVVVTLACIFALAWPGMSHFINQVLLLTRIGGGVEARLQVRAEVGCRLPLPADMVRQCREGAGRPTHLAMPVWLSFQAQERLYIRLRPLEANDRKAQIVLNRASVDLIQYVDGSEPTPGAPRTPPAPAAQQGPS